MLPVTLEEFNEKEGSNKVKFNGSLLIPDVSGGNLLNY